MLNSDGMRRGLNRRVLYLARFGLPFHADITLLSSSQGSKADSFMINHHLSLSIFSSAKVRLQGSHKQS